MIVADTSAIMAIIADEADGPIFHTVMRNAGRC